MKFINSHIIRDETRTEDREKGCLHVVINICSIQTVFLYKETFSFQQNIL